MNINDLKVVLGADGIYRRSFQVLFDHINLKRGFGWDVNPWVWVLGYAPSAFGTSPILRERQNGGGSSLEVQR